MALVNIGTKLLNGQDARGCPHMAEWAPVYTRYLIHLGIIRRTLDIVQAAGGSPKSGGTHIEGTCLDLAGSQCSTVAVEAAREGGAPATWGRGPWVKRLGARPAAINGFGDHVHLHILCPCKSGADYQTAEVKRGQDGLYGSGSDYHAKPSQWRDYRAGMAWMEAQMAATASKAQPTITAASSAAKSATAAPRTAATATTTGVDMSDYETFSAYMDRYGVELAAGKRGDGVLRSWGNVAWNAGFGKPGSIRTPLQVVQGMIDKAMKGAAK